MVPEMLQVDLTEASPVRTTEERQFLFATPTNIFSPPDPVHICRYLPRTQKSEVPRGRCRTHRLICPGGWDICGEIPLPVGIQNIANAVAGNGKTLAVWRRGTFPDAPGIETNDVVVLGKNSAGVDLRHPAGERQAGTSWATGVRQQSTVTLTARGREPVHRDVNDCAP